MLKLGMFTTNEIKLSPFPSLSWLTLISIIYLGFVSFVSLYVGNFDWTMFLMGMCFEVMSITMSYILFKKINNNEDVMRIKFELYNTIKNKSNICNTINNIMYSRNRNVINNIKIFCLSNKNINSNLIEDKVKYGTVIKYLEDKGLDNKTLKRIEKELKIYNNKDDLKEFLRQIETKELIQKKEIGGFAAMITAISFILAVLCFFRVDYVSINITQNLIFLIVYFSSMTFYMLKKSKEYKNELFSIYIALNEIFHNEKFIRSKNFL